VNEGVDDETVSLQPGTLSDTLNSFTRWLELRTGLVMEQQQNLTTVQ
jgi:hypothetical protein